MKKSIMLMLLGAAIVGSKAEATVIINDSLNHKGLWHMENVGTWWGVRSTANDTSVRGTPIHTGALRVSPDGEEGVVATTPSFHAGSPYGGNFLQFDGVDDDAHARNVWEGDKSSLALDFGLNMQGWTPSVQGAKMGLIQVWDWRMDVIRDGGLHYLELSVLNAAQTGWSVVRSATAIPNALTWYDVHAEFDGDFASITFNGQTTSTVIVGGTSQSDGLLIMGRDLNSNANYFNGRLDEVSIANIPEPATIGLLGLASIVLIGARRFRM